MTCETNTQIGLVTGPLASEFYIYATIMSLDTSQWLQGLDK